MIEVAHAAITKSDALRALVEQWTLDLSKIKSPESEYREKRQVLLSNYDNALSQLQQQSLDPNEFVRRSEAILRQAGDIRELEIQYQSSATLLERQFAERLEAANKRLACELFQTLGDTLWDHSVSTVLHQCISPKDTAVEAGSVEKGSSVVLEARKDPDTDHDVTIEAPRNLEGSQNQSSPPITGSSEHQDYALVQTPASREVRASASGDTLHQRKSAVNQTAPAQEQESASQSNLVTDRQATTLPLAVQVPTPSSTPEASRHSDDIAGTQAKSSSIAMPASETNLGQNRGARRWNLWQTSQTPNQSRSSTQRAENLSNKPPGQQPTDSLAFQLRSPLKRFQMETSNREQKRQRLPIERPNIPEERVTHFDQVFQGGNAQTKYIVVQHPPLFGDWYILECKEHNKHFHRDPIREASQHLMCQEHGINGDHSLAVKMLGTRVLYCDEKLAAKNNWITRQSFLEIVRPTNVIPGNRTKDDATQDIDVIPIVGKIYATRFPQQSHTCPVLVLPWTAFDHFPNMRQLLRHTPACFVFDKTVDRYPRGWAKDYEDGGRKFKDRTYPVVYLNKENFPEQCDVGWVRISNFRIYDPEHTGVVCSKIVDRYLQNKDPRLAANHGFLTDNSIIIPDDDDKDTHMRVSTEHVNSELSGNASRKESNMCLKVSAVAKNVPQVNTDDIKDEKMGQSPQLQAESRSVDPRTFYNSASQSDTTHVSRSQIHTKEHGTIPGPTARIEYPFVSGGSEDAGHAATSHAAASTSKGPVVNVVELGEVHAENGFCRPVP
ncbi:hypothetical protein F52700_4087 [Fusarium sp. NRRL 52700]|nr:hypothetical protein F52700_4087 [Fusarium sp. NRRL 52700]